MFDEEVNEDVILPEDYTEEIPAEEIQEEVAPEAEEEENMTLEDENEGQENEGEEEGTPAETEPFLKVKYNKQEVELTQEQVVELSQKGMNYDKLMERYNQAVNNPTIKYFEDLAERNGMDLNGLVDYYRQQEEQAEIDYLTREKGLTEELAKEVMENRKFRQQLESERQTQNQEKQREAEWRRQQEAFMERYPQVDPKNIPQSVWDEWKNGTELVNAYTAYENEQLRKENAILKQNHKNKETAPIKNGISVNGSKSPETEDAFLIGFNSI